MKVWIGMLKIPKLEEASKLQMNMNSKYSRTMTIKTLIMIGRSWRKTNRIISSKRKLKN